MLCAFILVESAIPGGESGGQSNWISQIIANVLNWFSGDTPAEIIEPIGLKLATDGDSSLLGEGKIATGTTTLLEFDIEEASYSKGQTTSREFRYEKMKGENFDVLISSYTDNHDTMHTLARIVSKGEAEEDCVVRFYAGTTSNVYYDYHFDVVDLPAPEEGEYTVALEGYDSEKGYVLSKNEAVNLEVTLSKNGRNDAYLRRYYDPRKLEAKSNDEAVATIDENGLILAKEAGTAAVSYGNYSFIINVDDSSVTIGDSLSVTSSGSLSENDYDELGTYADNHPEATTMEAANSITCGVILEASDGLADSEATYTWEVVDENGNPDYLGGKIVPLDAKGKKARLLGYRKGPNEKVYAKCTLNGGSITQNEEFSIIEILPVSMSIGELTSGYENHARIVLPEETYFSSKQLTLTGTFLGEGGNTNVTNRALVASDYDESAFTVTGNNSTSLNLTFMKEGTYSIRISSAANPDLYYELVFPIETTPNVDPTSGAFRSFIRKFIGHGSLFAFTAIFGMIFFALAWGKEKSLLWPTLCSLGTGLLVGGLSELIQMFVPERGPAWLDVGIDFLGYLIGTLMVLLIIFIVRHVRKNKEKKKALAQDFDILENDVAEPIQNEQAEENPPRHFYLASSYDDKPRKNHLTVGEVKKKVREELDNREKEDK